MSHFAPPSMPLVVSDSPKPAPVSTLASHLASVRGEYTQIVFIANTRGYVVRSVDERFTTFTKHLGFTPGQALTRIGYEFEFSTGKR
jgi:hypothetical protein